MVLPILLIRFSWVNEGLSASRIELRVSDLGGNLCFFREMR